MANNILLKVEDLYKHFPIRKGFTKQIVGHVKAVDGVSLSIEQGKTLGLVGESGSGKTTTGRCILRAIEPTRGHVRFQRRGEEAARDVTALDKPGLRDLRRHVQLIFQDPFSSLNPRMTIRQIIGEPLRVNKIARGSELNDRVRDVMKRVGLRPEYMTRYPHAFSGGQRQRIGIARALVLNPDLIVCDEPVSALDVSVQAQIINLLQDLQAEFGLTYLFIAHDLAVVEHISNHVAVMYAGRIMEYATSKDLFLAPKHPYTVALLAAVPKPHPRDRLSEIPVKGELADNSTALNGCPFHPRCPHAAEECRHQPPPLRGVAGNEAHQVACHRVA